MENSGSGRETASIEEFLDAPEPTAAMAEAARTEVAYASADLSRHLISAIRRARDSGQDNDAFEHLLLSAQRHLVDLELEAERAELAESSLGEDEPARRRVLSALRQKPQQPTVLASQLGLAPATVSRVLSAAADRGQVTFTYDLDDRRRRVYSLTANGLRDTRLRDAAFGVLGAPEPDRDERRQYLVFAIKQAVEARRHSNRLADAAVRLRVVIEQSAGRGFEDIELCARRELITTLRQLGDLVAADDEISILGRVSEGETEDASLVLPAHCHYQYELGRHARHSVNKRAAFLEAAFVGYTQLVHRTRSEQREDAGEEWGIRAAWSSASLAENLREQTQLGRAIDQALGARTQFEALGDEYGIARCDLLLGFCYRLRGQFAAAEPHLNAALAIAKENGYTRWQADVLTQMGDVQRCLGLFEPALSTLDEALAIARRLDMTVTRGFAESAKGVALFHCKEFDGALLQFEAARICFDKARHAEGSALNLRRLAVAERHLELLDESVAHSIDSYRQYQPLKSPAGLTACLVNLGHSFENLKQREHVDVVCDFLLKTLRQPSQRILLEKDPWVPQSLHKFAASVEHADLEADAKLVLVAAQSRLGEVLSPPSQLAVSTDSQAESFLDALRHSTVAISGDLVWSMSSRETAVTFGRVDEMAGEPRRDAERQPA